MAADVRLDEGGEFINRQPILVEGSVEKVTPGDFGKDSQAVDDRAAPRVDLKNRPIQPGQGESRPRPGTGQRRY